MSESVLLYFGKPSQIWDKCEGKWVVCRFDGWLSSHSIDGVVSDDSLHDTLDDAIAALRRLVERRPELTDPNS